MIQLDPIVKQVLEKASKASAIDDLVILKRDEQGNYIEYALKEGAPHDNRCLSWYDSFQEEAYIRNGWSKGMIENTRKRIEDKIGKIFWLGEFSCGHENEEGELHCSAGHPMASCRGLCCKNWTYEQPVKCACWHLRDEVKNIKDIRIGITVGELTELLNNH